jgi:hypothetical protein
MTTTMTTASSATRNGQKDRWRGDLVLRSGVDPHTKMMLYTVEHGTISS